MKTITIKLLAVVILFFSVSDGLAKGKTKKKTEAPVAILMKVVKDVSFKKEKGDWTNAKVGVPLMTNDEIKTGAGSLALIKFTDNSVLRVRENSNLKIFADKNKDVLSKNTQIDRGKVGFQVTKQENEEFRFTTPTMVASIRGTGGLIGVDDEGGSSLICEEGTIDIKATQGLKEETTVNGGSYVVVNNSGTINQGQNGPQQNNQLNNAKRTKVKKLILKTTNGDIEIEYVVEE